MTFLSTQKTKRSLKYVYFLLDHFKMLWQTAAWGLCSAALCCCLFIWSSALSRIRQRRTLKPPTTHWADVQPTPSTGLPATQRQPGQITKRNTTGGADFASPKTGLVYIYQCSRNHADLTWKPFSYTFQQLFFVRQLVSNFKRTDYL